MAMDVKGAQLHCCILQTCRVYAHNVTLACSMEEKGGLSSLVDKIKKGANAKRAEATTGGTTSKNLA